MIKEGNAYMDNTDQETMQVKLSMRVRVFVTLLNLHNSHASIY